MWIKQIEKRCHAMLCRLHHILQLPPPSFHPQTKGLIGIYLTEKLYICMPLLHISVDQMLTRQFSKGSKLTRRGNNFIAVTSYNTSSRWSQHTQLLHKVSSRCANVLLSVAFLSEVADRLETDGLTAHKHRESWLERWTPNWRIRSTSPIIILIAYKLPRYVWIVHILVSYCAGASCASYTTCAVLVQKGRRDEQCERLFDPCCNRGLCFSGAASQFP